MSKQESTINVHEAKTHFSKLLVRIQQGEEVIIAKSGRPIARLVPIEAPRAKRKPDTAKGKVWIADDFDASLPKDLEDTFYS